METAARYVYCSGKLDLESKSIEELERLISKVVAATKKKFASIIIPTYNEAGNIRRLIDSLSQSMEKAGYPDFEIIVADDNSKDTTPSIIDEYAKTGKVAAVHRYGIRGIFSAIKDSVRLARGTVVIIMDADFSHPPSKVPELLSKMKEKDYDIVSGSRFMKGGRIDSPFLRKFATVLFNSVIRFVMGFQITDWTGGFHAIKREKFLGLNFKYPAKWGEFDLEVLYRAKKAGFRMAEIPFSYSFREEGQSKATAESFAFFFGYAWLYGKRALQLRFGK
jgi:dolichol-phosphate mannosyltransferase